MGRLINTRSTAWLIWVTRKSAWVAAMGLLLCGNIDISYLFGQNKSLSQCWYVLFGCGCQLHFICASMLWMFPYSISLIFHKWSIVPLHWMSSRLHCLYSPNNFRYLKVSSLISISRIIRFSESVLKAINYSTLLSKTSSCLCAVWAITYYNSDILQADFWYVDVWLLIYSFNLCIAYNKVILSFSRLANYPYFNFNCSIKWSL